MRNSAAQRTRASSAIAPSSLKPILVLRKARLVMDVFSEDQHDLTFTDVLTRSELPPSTCLRILNSLVREGFLDRFDDRYRPGVRLKHWASIGGGASGDLTKQASPVLERLRDLTGETACLYVRDGMVRTCIAVEETRHPVVRIIRIGQVMPLHAGSAGKVFLAYSDNPPRVLGKALPAYTPRTITSRGELQKELARIRIRGYAMSFEERDTGAASVSAPVRDASGETVAAIGIVGPIQRLDRQTARSSAGAVLIAATTLSRSLGYRTGAERLAGNGFRARRRSNRVRMRTGA